MSAFDNSVKRVWLQLFNEKIAGIIAIAAVVLTLFGVIVAVRNGLPQFGTRHAAGTSRGAGEPSDPRLHPRRGFAAFQAG
ncbi:MAG: hypothetical protein MZV49_07070 [Rhodopseudomonas palustris]|nr:hypothetical protein [Rhodopseudomonas palustris]